jgi:hypothetical protein
VARRGLLDRLFRERSGRHLQLAVERDVVRRGDSVTLTLTFAEPDRAGENVEVGIVCIERYAERQQRQSQSGGTTTTRVMLSATAYERWEPAQASQPLQRFTFEIPKAAPYSYDGEHLEFHWRASAREPRALRPDPATNLDLTVRP